MRPPPLPRLHLPIFCTNELPCDEEKFVSNKKVPNTDPQGRPTFPEVPKDSGKEALAVFLLHSRIFRWPFFREALGIYPDYKNHALNIKETTKMREPFGNRKEILSKFEKILK